MFLKQSLLREAKTHQLVEEFPALYGIVSFILSL